MEKRIKTKRRKKCTTCIYRGAKYDYNGCDYMVITGHRRGCSVENCDKHVKGERLTANTTPAWERGLQEK